MDTGADNTLLCGNLNKFSGSTETIERYGGQIISVQQVPVTLGISRLPPQTYQVHISPIQEYILGIDVLQSLTVNTTADEFCLSIQVVKAIIQGRLHRAPLVPP